MSVQLNPYLSFRDDAREAMSFYQSVLGGELTFSTFAEFGMADDPADADKIMHGLLETPDGLVLMGADTPGHMEHAPVGNPSIALFGDDETVLTGYWRGLSEGATIQEELSKAPWGDSFGMLVDRFGVPWMVNITAAAA